MTNPTIKLSQSAFKHALGIATKATPTRGSMPILGGLHLHQHGDTLTITGTNLEMTAIVNVDSTGDPHAAVYPARILNDIIKTLPDGAVTLTLNDTGDESTITSGNFTATVRLLPADEYPKIESTIGETVTIPGTALADAFKQTTPAASTDDSRPILTGIQMEPEGDGLRLVATDSYRLAVRDMPGTTLNTGDTTVLVPAEAVNEVHKLLTVDDVDVTIGERQASFTIGDTTITTRLIEGNYPNYRALIPDTPTNILTIPREPFIDAIKRIRLLARETTTPVRLRLNDDIHLWTRTQEIGEAHETLDGTYEGEPLEIGFNPDYLTAGLEAATSDTVTLEVTDSQKPAVIRDTGTQWLYLLMPVRIS